MARGFLVKAGEEAAKGAVQRRCEAEASEGSPGSSEERRQLRPGKRGP